MQVRKAAVETLVQVFESALKADTAIQNTGQYFQVRDRKLLHECVYGVLRWRYSLEVDFSRFCKSKPDKIAYAALALGTYQIRHMRIPRHAAVSETVAAMQQINPKAAGFVNAILRRVADNEAPIKLKPNQRAELPKWMYSQWRDTFGADAVQSFCEALKHPPLLCLAVFIDREAWITKVKALGIIAEIGELSPFAVLLPLGCDVTALPGFKEGDFTVMDQAAQAAVMALKTPTSSHPLIVDVCAAPGGKTALLAHCFPQACIVAIEFNEKRIPRLLENLSRLRCENVTVIQADAIHLPFGDNSIDALFLDAPCSASGILRRHPDAKFLHSIAGLEKLSRMQIAMIKESLRALKVDAKMTYSVCSIHPQENEQVLNQINKTHLVNNMVRLFPDIKHDGFFHARIEKRMMPTL